MLDPHAEQGDSERPAALGHAGGGSGGGRLDDDGEGVVRLGRDVGTGGQRGFQRPGELLGKAGVAQDRLVVTTPEGDDVAVPFVAELVPSIDPEAGTVTLDPPGGLFPGYGQAEEAR